MELKLNRIAKKNGYTIGRLSINGKYFSDTLEDSDRGLSSSMSLDILKKKKLPHITAIPTGRYQITMDVVSPRFSKSKFYQQFGGGRVPRLLNVPAYQGVLIHCGNYAGYETFFKKVPISKNKQVLSIQEYVDVV